jgi:hypothetical protein
MTTNDDRKDAIVSIPGKTGATWIVALHHPTDFR